MPITRVHLEREALKDHQDQVDLEEIKETQVLLAHPELLDSKVQRDCRVHLVPKETRVPLGRMVQRDHQGPQDHREIRDEIFQLHNQPILKDQLSSTRQRTLLTECLEKKLPQLCLKT